MTAKTCRLCLSEDGEFYGLFDLADRESLRIVDEINHLLNIRIYEDDRLPRSICSNCYKILDFFKEFRLTCLKVNNFLLEQIDLRSHLAEENFLEAIKSDKKCTYLSPMGIRTSQLVTENAEETNMCVGRDNNRLNSNFLDFVCNYRRDNCKTKMPNYIYRGDMKGKDFSDMPPLISVDELKTKKSQITKQYSEEQNSALKYNESSPVLTEIVEGSVAEKCLSEANSFEASGLWNNKENVLEDCSTRSISELADKDDFHTVQQNNPPLTSTQVREQNPSRELEIINKPFPCFSSTNLNEYLPKSEEIILSESECDTEIPNNESVDIGDGLIQDLDGSDAEVISISSSGSSDLNDLVDKLPDKILKYETDFNKATLDTLLVMQNNGKKLSNSVVKETAKKIARDRGNTKFTGSKGWMISFYKRFNIEPHKDEVVITPNNLQARTLSNRFIIRYCCNEVNEYTFNECESILNKGAELSAKLIQNIASKIAQDEGLPEFIATTGWLNSFRRKYVVNLRGRKNPMLHFDFQSI